jgi:hypothetical protein
MEVMSVGGAMVEVEGEVEEEQTLEEERIQSCVDSGKEEAANPA